MNEDGGIKVPIKENDLPIQTYLKRKQLEEFM